MSHLKHDFYAQLLEQLKPIRCSEGVKLKLILHVGTPKTGTTSLQKYFDKKQSKLRRKGVLYPHNLDKVQNPTAPKHHWFEKILQTTHLEQLLENVKNVISQVKIDTHTIILSSEGVYNHWWDFPEQSKVVLSELVELFDLQLWVWFREPLEFIERYYKQCIRNPQLVGNPCYGKDLSFGQMLDIEWFSQHLNYQGFVSECQALFGKTKVSIFKYEGDVVQQVSEMLGLATPHDNPTLRKNRSLNNASISLLRALNRYDIKAKDKQILMPHIRSINEVLNSYENEPIIDAELKDRVLKISKPIDF